jgi:hypothetical protein
MFDPVLLQFLILQDAINPSMGIAFAFLEHGFF